MSLWHYPTHRRPRINRLLADVKTAVELIRQGKVPTADLLGEVVTVDGFGDALRLLSRQLPGRDAIRLSLSLVESDY